MINRPMATSTVKKQKLRNNEYYDTQTMFDELYSTAKNKPNYKFYKLMDLINSKENIELAYRNIKKNKGSKTKGSNGKTIDDIAMKTNEELVNYVRNRLKNYTPHSVRRVEIPKRNGKIRPLGIPSIEDRIIQQCIKQVLEPICEAKFYNHSYGFRPNRSTHHAVAKSVFYMQKNNLHYVVDIDIKGFFDNVDHSKLLKQMWTLGIQDKQLLCIISKMLKAPIENVGIPSKGTPQGGILSPLLSNIVLNELDWWIAKQWEYFETNHNYDMIRNGKIERSHKYRALRKSKMKEIFIVRYADDFKIFCKDFNTAQKIFHATQMWLKERLNLDISEEKSKIVNLKKNYSEFLGFKLKIKSKGNKKVVKSHISDRAKKDIVKQLKEKIKNIKRDTTIVNVGKYNATVIGIQNYYSIATDVYEDFRNISYIVNRTIYNQTRKLQSKTGIKSELYKRVYGKYNMKPIYIRNIPLFPLTGVKHIPPMNIKQDICSYSKEGRAHIHARQKGVSINILKYILENPIPSQSIEYNDNRLSLLVGQNGLCKISKEPLEIGGMHCHHKKPKHLGGTDEYKNLIIIKADIHRLIHATNQETIKQILNTTKLNEKSLKEVNKLRILVGNCKIA